KEKKADKQDELTQDPFNYVAKDTSAPVASTSGTSKTSKIPEPVINEPKTIELSESIKPINKITNISSKENKPPEPINQVSSDILLFRVQREQRLRKWAIDHGEDPDVFVTITEKDIRLFHEYRDRMMSDADAIDFTKED
ncbi:hypothetical protein RhiirC2_722855, partial [Rhizophagus irregularis]